MAIIKSALAYHKQIFCRIYSEFLVCPQGITIVKCIYMRFEGFLVEL